MAEPAYAPITIWQGDNAPSISWDFPFAIAGDDFLLRLLFKGREIRRRVSEGGLTLDGEARRVTWRYEGADFAGVTSDGAYELTRYAAGGEIRTYVAGSVQLKRIS